METIYTCSDCEFYDICVLMSVNVDHPCNFFEKSYNKNKRVKTVNDYVMQAKKVYRK